MRRSVNVYRLTEIVGLAAIMPGHIGHGDLPAVVIGSLVYLLQVRVHDRVEALGSELVEVSVHVLVREITAWEHA